MNAIVIGTGVGGLAAAIRLRCLGYTVTVLEALPDAGGRARVFEQDGFKFDAGPTVITAPYLFEELFELAGRDWRDYYQLMPVDPFYRILFHDGSSFDYVGDEDRLIENIRAFSPGDVDGYRRLSAHSERIFDVGFTELADVPFDSVMDMMKVVPAMMKLQNYRSVYSLVAKYIKDERLRQVFTFQPLLIGGNPFRTTSIYLLIHWVEKKWGVHYALGGTGSIVNALLTLMDELGIEVIFDAVVDEIQVHAGRVEAVATQDGRRFKADVVVSNADPSTTYKKLIAPEARKRYSDSRIARTRNSMSLFVGYFGTDKVWDNLAHHTILLGPRYKAHLNDVFSRKVLADDFSLYLHAPTRTDPSMAPDGQDSMYVLSPVPNNRSGLDWESIKDEYFDRILESLESRVMPGLGEHIVTRRSITPDYFEQRLRSADGAAFGPEPLLQQSAWFRFHNRSEDVDGLYFVGAGTHPGAGLPGVLCTAKVLERVVERPSRADRVPLPKARA